MYLSYPIHIYRWVRSAKLLHYLNFYFAKIIRLVCLPAILPGIATSVALHTTPLSLGIPKDRDPSNFHHRADYVCPVDEVQQAAGCRFFNDQRFHNRDLSRHIGQPQ